MFVFEAINVLKDRFMHLLYDVRRFDLKSFPFRPKEGVSGLPSKLIQIMQPA